MLDEVGMQPFLVRGRLFIGRPFLFGRLARDQPRQPALPAGEPVARFGDNRRARFGDDVRDLARRGGACLDDLEPGHGCIPSLNFWTA